ncbi:MAG: hypothetical protein R3D59_14055 [Paracoccaceae bacterium]
MTFVTSLAAPITLPLVLLIASVSVPVPRACGKSAPRDGRRRAGADPARRRGRAVRAQGLGPVSRRLDPVARLLFLAIVLATFWQNWGDGAGVFRGFAGAVTLFAVLAPPCLPRRARPGPGGRSGVRSRSRRRCRTWP